MLWVNISYYWFCRIKYINKTKKPYFISFKKNWNAVKSSVLSVSRFYVFSIANFQYSFLNEILFYSENFSVENPVIGPSIIIFWEFV